MESYLPPVLVQLGPARQRVGARSGDVEWMLSATAQLKYLNSCFLQLPQIAKQLPPNLAAVQSLSPAMLDAIAGGSYSLFSLRWETAARWHSVIAHRRACSGQQVSGSKRDFVLSALFFAWHLLRSSTLACSYTLDMHDEVQAAFSRFPLADLPQLASLACQWLQPRWPHHPQFWPELLRYGQQGDATGVRNTLLFGRQLLSGAKLLE
jgi:hypothetical protein